MYWIRIRKHERGLLFKDGEFQRVLAPGRHIAIDPRYKVEVVNLREAWFAHPQLDLMHRSGELKGLAAVQELDAHERALVWIDGKFEKIAGPGLYALWTAFRKVTVQTFDLREPCFQHADLRELVAARAIEGLGQAVDLKDHQRALVWVEGRFHAILKPGLYALWTAFRDVRMEIVDAVEPLFHRDDLPVIANGRGAAELLEVYQVEPHMAALYFKDGKYAATLKPGMHAFWKGLAKVTVAAVDLREQVLDVAGQEIMTADKVTLRLNAVVSYRVADPVKTVSVAEDYKQALYREAQLAIRAGIGARELDVLLAGKDALAGELEGVLKNRATAFGLEVQSFGIRDVILPGEMKDLLNKVTEARKAAEASLITRREETAAMRMQANTAKILESNPTLMRLRELEVLEKVAEKSKLTVMLGEKGLTERVVKLL
jgi:regulator of protease activity HflC (stomatin/prohibitin superfamily)